MNDYFDDDIPYEDDFDDIPIEDDCSDFEEGSEHGPSEDEECPIEEGLTGQEVFFCGTMMGLAYEAGLEDGQYRKKAEKERYKMEISVSELPKAGPRSAFVGNIAETNKKTYFDLDKFQIHTLIAGASGSGKTVAAQALVEEALLKDVAVIIPTPFIESK